MATPTAYFTFIASGLSVTFTDKSSGSIDSWFWDFGHESSPGNPVTSNTQNPPAIVFPASGKYIVSLSVTNSEGSDTYVYDLVVSTTPVINTTILGLVKCDLPGGVSLDLNCFQNSVKKWQLFLQDLVTPKISDTDVFDETKWTSLQNVFIAKLTLYDLIVKAASSTITSFSLAVEAYNSQLGNVTENTIYVADYTVNLVPLDFGLNTFTVDNLIINGSSLPVPGNFTSINDVIVALNNLAKGQFIYNQSSNSIQSIGNSNILTTFSYTHGGGINTAFTVSNPRVVPVNYVVQSSSSSTGMTKGPLKKMEVGPSSAEWYDSSDFWSTIFRGSSGSGSPAGGSSGGLLAFIKEDICMYASRLGVAIYLCPKLPNKTHLFIR